jgi:EAL domain-containing protein (putative c-di-GMP-specific phosphodiesterase class I)
VSSGPVHSSGHRPGGLSWYLESLVGGGRQLSRIPIRQLPFRIGRRPDVDLTLHSSLVSKLHAEIYLEGEALRLRDLGSTNGTFVCREKVADAPIQEGDILHFADCEFRLAQQEPGEETRDAGATYSSTIARPHLDLPRQFVEGARELRELLREGRVAPVFEPIVSLETREVVAYEALGRGRHPRLPESPLELFRIASTIGAEAELSRLFRRKAIERVAHRGDLPLLFFNTHPAEIDEPGLVGSLEELRRSAPHLRIAIEFPESALIGAADIARLRGRLRALGMALAYDDFGTGQARLIELSEVPPDYLKFDRRFIRGIDRATPPRRRLLRSLVAMTRDLGVQSVAEGVETAPEAALCQRLGFTLGQGRYYGEGVPLDHL